MSDFNTKNGWTVGEWTDVPVIPPLEGPDLPCDPNPVVAKCGQCGLNLHRVMGYVCSHPRCPCFPRVTC